MVLFLFAGIHLHNLAEHLPTEAMRPLWQPGDHPDGFSQCTGDAGSACSKRIAGSACSDEEVAGSTFCLADPGSFHCPHIDLGFSN